MLVAFIIGAVRLSTDVGPAVIGAIRPRIVLPAWTLGLDAAKRSLILRHEAEHVRARDPLVLRVATLALALFPWNVALWFIVRRLRHSVEIDCDARVLRAAADETTTRDYGMLLLLVSAHRAARPALAMSLAAHPPFLERRIKAMTPVRTTRPVLASFALIAGIAATTIAAARAPVPASLRPVKGRTAPARSSSDHQSASRRSFNTTPRPVRLAPVRVVSEQRHAPRPLLPLAETHPAIAAPMHEAAPQTRVTASRAAMGRVLDSATSAPLANVYVRVIGIQALGEPNWTCSDANGDFRLNVPAGEAWLSAQSADHAFARAILTPTDSVAVMRGVPIAARSRPPQLGLNSIRSIAVTPPSPRPLIIVDGVVQPGPADSAHLTIRTVGGQVFEREWRVGDPTPRIIVDGVELSWSADTPGYSNPCLR